MGSHHVFVSGHEGESREMKQRHQLLSTMRVWHMNALLWACVCEAVHKRSLRCRRGGDEGESALPGVRHRQDETCLREARVRVSRQKTAASTAAHQRART